MPGFRSQSTENDSQSQQNSFLLYHKLSGKSLNRFDTAREDLPSRSKSMPKINEQSCNEYNNNQ